MEADALTHPLEQLSLADLPADGTRPRAGEGIDGRHSLAEEYSRQHSTDDLMPALCEPSDETEDMVFVEEEPANLGGSLMGENPEEGILVEEDEEEKRDGYVVHDRFRHAPVKMPYARSVGPARFFVRRIQSMPNTLVSRLLPIHSRQID